MAAVNRIVERLLASDVPLRPREVILAARRIAEDQAPLERDAAIAAALEVVGLGVLEPLLADPEVSDVLVNAPNEVWIEKRGVLERTGVQFSGPDAVVAAVERVIAPLGLRLDRASPAVDARLPDGSRLHAVIPPAAVDGPAVAIPAK